ncbi:DsbA family oxidoreductase [Glutamicibacter sp. MNS18]|uniref:DsbA family oxidoreductase n=1 Tax=Glutamicibacter sp. MNS18 TaxID=2989817 RepID=UPI0022356F4C|nr:DsbA family oxidoreductase [Glutamicibacter sp. MNS18]MCW4465863.1 DsbA family oxidoreductase [Glutamicibacter sp. MNS18]
MSENRLRVDIWSDIACPWCYIGKRRFEAALELVDFSTQVDVHWHAYQLDPSLPEHYEGTEHEYLSTVKSMDPEQVTAMLAHVTGQAAAEGLAYDFDAVQPANSFSALRLLEYAKRHGAGDEIKEALLEAHFVRGANTGDHDTLAALAAQVGLDRQAAAAVLADGSYADEVNADINQARQLGISGVPFFVLQGKYGISGAQPAQAFAEALRTVHAEL